MISRDNLYLDIFPDDRLSQVSICSTFDFWRVLFPARGRTYSDFNRMHGKMLIELCELVNDYHYKDYRIYDSTSPNPPALSLSNPFLTRFVHHLAQTQVL